MASYRENTPHAAIPNVGQPTAAALLAGTVARPTVDAVADHVIFMRGGIQHMGHKRFGVQDRLVVFHLPCTVRRAPCTLFFTIFATDSTWYVCGNMSTGWISVTS